MVLLNNNNNNDNVTVTCPLAESYFSRAGHEADSAASCKEEKYVDLGARYIFEQIAVETLGLGHIQHNSLPPP